MMNMNAVNTFNCNYIFHAHLFSSIKKIYYLFIVLNIKIIVTRYNRKKKVEMQYK